MRTVPQASILLAASALALVLPVGASAAVTAMSAPVSAVVSGSKLAPIAQRQDQVVVLQRGSAVPYSGVVLENTLAGVLMEVRGKDKRFKAEEVLRVEFHQVPPLYNEARGLLRAGLAAQAATAFLSAADDSDASDAVRASAQLRAVESLLGAGAQDDQAFDRAADLAATFAASQADNREVPHARLLEARALRLAGRSGDAAAKYAAVFGEADGDQTTDGYGLVVCYEAGLGAALSHLDAGDADAARQAFNKLDADLTGVLAGLDDDDPRAGRLSAIGDRASLSEGWVLLAGDKATQAKSYFQNQLDAAPDDKPILASLARLGVALSAQAAGQQRDAQLAFAETSATAVPDDDLVASAMLGLAETTLELGDPNARSTARALLEEILSRYAATPSLRSANQALANL